MAVASTWRSNLKPIDSNLRNNSLKEKSASYLELSRNISLKTWPKRTEPGNKRQTEQNIGSNSPRGKYDSSLESIKTDSVLKTWPKKSNEESISRGTERKSPTSRWSHLSATKSFKRSKSPIKVTPKKNNERERITADELLAREFSPEKVVTPRQRSSVFLRTVEMFEGEIPGKLQNAKPEDNEVKIENAKLDFCSNEIADMKRFIAQIEEDFLLIRENIEKTKDRIKDFKSEDRSRKLGISE